MRSLDADCRASGRWHEHQTVLERITSSGEQGSMSLQRACPQRFGLCCLSEHLRCNAVCKTMNCIAASTAGKGGCHEGFDRQCAR